MSATTKAQKKAPAMAASERADLAAIGLLAVELTRARSAVLAARCEEIEPSFYPYEERDMSCLQSLREGVIEPSEMCKTCARLNDELLPRRQKAGGKLSAAVWTYRRRAGDFDESRKDSGAT